MNLCIYVNTKGWYEKKANFNANETWKTWYKKSAHLAEIPSDGWAGAANNTERKQ